MSWPTRITPEMNERMVDLRTQGKTLREIGTVFGISATAVQYRVDPAYRERQNAKKKSAEQRSRESKRQADERDAHLHGFGRYMAGIGPAASRPPPPEVLAERDVAYASRERFSIAEITGDPPRGRSALDKKRGTHADL